MSRVADLNTEATMFNDYTRTSPVVPFHALKSTWPSVGWGLFSALVVYPIKTRRSAKKAREVAVAEANQKAAAPVAKPSFAAVRKGIRKG